MRVISFLCFFLILSVPGKTQGQEASVNWSVNPFDQRVFVENKGQFPADVLFEASSGGVQIYFSARGLTYKYDELIRKGEASQSKREGHNEHAPETISHFMHMNWLGADPAVKIIAEGVNSDYFAYGSISGTKVATYNKIIYKELYPNIDVQYVLPKDSAGIKYSIILHPGADASLIKIKYSDAEGVALDDKGNAIIKSSFPKGEHSNGNFIEYAPKTFSKDSGKSIVSSFSVDKNIISFSLPSTLLGEAIIDPWVVNPVFTTNNKAFDIAKDAAGNVYVHGGGGGASVWKLKKFNSAGTPIWTYNTTYFATNNGYYGDLAVDPAGNSYITQGCCAGSVQKIGPSSAVVWNVNQGFHEFWCLAFNCTFTKLYIASGSGGPAMLNYSIANIDLNTGVISGSTVLPSGAAEPRAIGWGPNGNIYFVSCAPGNMVFGVTPTFTTVFSVPGASNLPYNGPSYSNGSIPAGGQNGIAANNKYVYTSNGLVLNKRNVLSGALVSTVNIPGGVADGNSGVVVDGCGNVYAGSSNGVYKYDSLLTFISSAPTSGPVYCLYEGSGGELLASGNGFIASLALSYCTANLNLNPSSTNVNCSGPNSGAASVTASGGSAPYAYSWSSGQSTQAITGLSAGNYTVTVTDVSGCKQSSATVAITASSVLTMTTTSTPACGTNNGTANANPTGGSGTYTYNWSPSGGTNATATGLNAGTYTVSVTDAGGCTGTATVTVSSGSITATAGPNSTICAGQSVTLTSSGGTNYSWSNGATTSAINVVPTGTTTYSVVVSSGNCSATRTVTVTVNSLPPVSISGNTTICSGETATLTASGGTNYSWSNGATASAITVNPSSLASYTVTTTNSNGCSSKATVSVSVSPPPVASVSNSTICAGQAASLTASGGGTYSWSNGQTTSSIVIFTAGSYSVIVSIGNCSAAASGTVTVNPNPVASVSGNSTITSGSLTTLTASGGGTYSWNTGGSNSLIVVMPSVTTVYCVTVTATNSCKDTACMTVTIDSVGCLNNGELFLPNAFSPNGDNENDQLKVYFRNTSCIKTFELLIYNRWGEEVFKTSDPLTGWDGYYNEKQEEAAVFAYYMRAVLISGQEIIRSGNITLVR